MPEQDQSDHTGAARTRGGSPRRRAALLATALTVPIVVLLAFAFTAGRGDDDSGSTGGNTATTDTQKVLGPVTVAPISANPGADAGCTALLAQLPVQLGPLQPRRVTSTSTFVTAWGDPPVVLRCGVARPAELQPGSTAQIYAVNAVAWLQTKTRTQDIFVAVDRSVYVEVTVPMKISFQPLPLFATAIGKALPAVCRVPDGVTTVADSELCTHRS